MQTTGFECQGSRVAGRLRERKQEIEERALARMYGISDPPETAELDYLLGLRESIAAAIEFGLEVLVQSNDRPPTVPAALLVQARRAAHAGVALDVVLRRYFSGYTFFATLVVEEAQREDDASDPADLLQHKSSQFDRLIGAVAEEYQREMEAMARPAPHIQGRLVERLLAGEVIDDGPLGYDVDTSWHLGLVLSDQEDAGEGLRRLAGILDCRLLYIRRRTGPDWAWLGKRVPLDLGEVRSQLEGEASFPPLAAGHPAWGIAGWRLSHRQARAVYPLLSQGGTLTSYAETGLLATIAKDDVLTASLHQIYIQPLTAGNDDGNGLKETVRAYLAAGRNISSAASALRLNRQTVRRRLRAVEEKIGRSLDACAAEVELALRLDYALCSPGSEGLPVPPRSPLDRARRRSLAVANMAN